MTTWRVPYVGHNWEELHQFVECGDRPYFYSSYSRVQLVTHHTSFRTRAAIQAAQGWLIS